MKPYYEDDLCTIYHGDCRDVLDGLAHLRVDFVAMDPPFNVPVKYEAADGEHLRSWGDLIVMEPFFADVFAKIRRVCSTRAQFYVCCDGDSYPVFYKAAMGLWPRSHLIVWYKPTGRRGRGWLHAHELVLHASAASTEYADGFRQDVIGIMPVRTLNRQHPAEKPGDLWTFLLEAATPAHRTFLDPFMGSGSSLHVARMQGRRAIGIEIEERFCEIAAKRLGQGVLALEGTR